MVQHTETILLGCCNIFYIYTILTNPIIVFMTSDDRPDISAQETLGQNDLNNDITYISFPAEQVQPFVCLGGQCVWETSEMPCVYHLCTSIASPQHFIASKIATGCVPSCPLCIVHIQTCVYLYFISECFICFCKSCTTEVRSRIMNYVVFVPLPSQISSPIPFS